MARKYWLVKSEPNVFSFNDLQTSPKQTTFWDGVRNYQARNFLKSMQVGDGVLFYHSRVEPMAIVGTATITETATPDKQQFDARSKYYDPLATHAKPRWFGVHLQYDRAFKKPVTLAVMRELEALREMTLLQRGSRLSVQPVDKKHWDIITKLAVKS